MTKEFKQKEDKTSDKIKALEAKLKFYVETQELIDQKNERIKGLEEKLNLLKVKDTNIPTDKEDTKSDKNNINNKLNSAKNKKKDSKTTPLDEEIRNNVLKEQNLVLQKKVDELSEKLTQIEQNYVDKIRQLRQENNIKQQSLFENDSKPESNPDDLNGRELIIN